MTDTNGLPASETHPVSSLVRPMYTILAIMLLASVIGVWYSRNSAASSGAVKNSQDLSTCRGIVKNDLDQATGLANQAAKEQSSAEDAGLIALLTGDKLTQFYVVMDGPISRKAIAETSALVVRKQELYTQALHLSKENPTRFLEMCRGY